MYEFLSIIWPLTNKIIIFAHETNSNNKPLKKYRHIFIFLFCLLSMQAGIARDVMRYQRYTVQDGLSHRMISGLMQDSIGNIWLSTWNGLCKFDGETFTTYNETSSHEKIGRLGLVRYTTNGQIRVVRQSDMQEFILNSKTGLLDTITKGSLKSLPVTRLSDENAPDSTGLVLIHDSIRYCIPYEGAGMTTNTHFNSFIDRQGNIWANFDDALYQITFDKPTYDVVDLVDPQHDDVTRYGDEIRATLQLHDGGFLLGGKNKYIYKYNADWQFGGYLAPDGNIVKKKTMFGARIYCMRQNEDGTVWMGSRGDGLYYVSSPKLDRNISGPATVRNYKDPQICNNHIYDLVFIGRERLIIATWDGGIQMLKINTEGVSSIITSNEKIRKTRRIVIINPDLFALCSTQGIVFVDKGLKERKHLGNLDFSDLLQSASGTFYASCLSGDVYTFNLNRTPSNIELDTLKLKRLELKETNNVIISIAETNEGLLWFISDNMLIKYNASDHTAQIIDRTAIGSEVIFGEAQPLSLRHHLLLGTISGRMLIDLDSPDGYCPRLVLSTPDTIQIEWGEDIPEIRTTAIDFRLPRLIQYAWRELPDSTWTILEEGGLLQFKELWPGTHQFEIRSTDSKEIWANNNRTITIIVSLTLWHKVAIVAIFLSLLLFVYWGWKANRPIPQIQQKQGGSISSGIQPSQPVVVARDQQFIEQVTKIVEDHIDDPMLDVEKMTSYMNTSRTILYSKFKDLLDVTPAAFINEIRLKRAIQLLETRQYRVNEIAVMCGFSDPKYFTRHFKQHMGVSPAKYIEEERKKKELANNSQ